MLTPMRACRLQLTNIISPTQQTAPEKSTLITVISDSCHQYAGVHAATHYPTQKALGPLHALVISPVDSTKHMFSSRDMI